ncbi:hypothetical protein PULV_a4010 [Pseudoalteromonas ulvae UL12]|uniref:DUF2976 domain-containing protein n=1 Tax=Pseudoalteromonas ulvae TaxID=107327 RepID=UPI00186B74E9|nr:DUF2976 domain-containing protein [Pseudoalteromonas ulvae]MBE0362199.1 hypothetical protein [Pseudoalteromonas ulvae UL12]
MKFNIKKKVSSLLSMVTLIFVQFQVWAETDLPLADEVAEQAEDKSVFEFAAYIIGGAIGVVLLALTGFAFVQSLSSTLTAFKEWQDGKGNLQELGMKVGVSVLLLVICIVIIGFGYAAFEEYL